ncbi:MAG: DUF4827 domain-containing protein [Bacteroidaceae bacterium]|nr:DUF4827 domain-containing protein [Bacteroidaceae bacterium]
MKNYLYALFGMMLCGWLISCHDDETYADKKEKERKAIQAFMKRDVAIVDVDGDTVCYVGVINVISEEQFYAQDSLTNINENEYVLFDGSGIYMQIVRKGVGEKLKRGESKRLICRFIEYNILGDSLQLRSDVNYWHTNPDILDVTNNSGTITATFNTMVNEGGAMYMTYIGNGTGNANTVPNGLLVPLAYVNIARQVASDEGIAKVRLIVPHSEGHPNSTAGVYPCFYEVLYQEMRD